MRLIDADALKENIKRQANMFKDTPVLSAYADIMERSFCAEIDNAPTIDIIIPERMAAKAFQIRR